jgi:hypothetical protein
MSKPVQVSPPEEVQVWDAGAGPPQPQRAGDLAPVREAGDGHADEVAADDGRLGEPGEPAAAEQLRVQPAPGHDGDVAVPLVIDGQFPVWGSPGGRVRALEPGALCRTVLSGPAGPAGDAGRRVAVEHPVVADADQDLHAVQVLAQVPGQRGLAVPAVEHVQRDPGLPGRAQPRRVRDDLPRGRAVRVVPGLHPGLVLRRGPGIRREGQLGQPLERPPGHHRAAAPGAVTVPGVPGAVPGTGMMVPLPARAGLRRRPRVRARVDRERRRPVPRPDRHQQVPQRLLIDPALGQGLVDHAVPAAEPRLQAQVRQRRHRPRRRQHRLRHLEQRVRVPPQAPVEPPPEPRQARQRLPGPGPALLARLRLPRHTGKHGRCPFSGR